jgi:hypothetical protein
MVKCSVNRHIIEISMSGTENIYRLKLYRTQNKNQVHPNTWNSQNSLQTC